MDGLFFLSSILGIGLVMWWVLQNDDVPPGGPTSGLFAMRPGSQLLKRRKLRDGPAAIGQVPDERKPPL